jgi:hypothetical protein
MDAEISWGTLGPESIESRRRTRTLGLGAAVRACNEAAVPGTGNLWYAKQLMLAALGVRLAEISGLNAILIANAIEALACLLGFGATANIGSVADSRLRGRRKLMGSNPDLPFKTVSKRGFYVSQPMRMGMAQPLTELGLAESENGSSRFNALRITEKGAAFLEEALKNYRPYRRTVEAHLLEWIRGDIDGNDTEALEGALSPLRSMPGGATAILLEQLHAGDGGKRRKNALAWVRTVTNDPRQVNDWNSRPKEIEDDHWRDLEAGARFFTTRNAAWTCLDAVEMRMARRGSFRLSFLDAVCCEEVASTLAAATKQARRFLDLKHIPEGAGDAASFAETLADSEQVQLLRFLVKLDGRVLTGRSDEIFRGAAFDADVASIVAPTDNEDDKVEEVARQSIPLPENTSDRVGRLALLCLDLDGKLDQWLRLGQPPSGAEQL